MALALKDDAWMLSPRGKANMTPNSQILLVDESSITFCKGCDKKFNVIIKKHHCRACGDVFCGQCSTKKTLLKGSRKVKQRMCEECTQYFRKEQLLLYSSIKINPTGDKLDENTDDILSDGENKENSKQIESSSPKRSPLREISKNDKENCQTPSSSLNSMTPLKSTSKGLMSQVKSTFKMTTALKPIEEIKEEEKLDIQSWTHSYTPPVNSPYALSPNFTPNGIVTSQQSILSEMKVNRIATPESMISSPVVLSPEVANIYTEPLTFSPAIHIDTFRIMLASIIVVILATAGMIVPQQSVQLRSNDSKISTVPVHFQEFNYIEEIKYEIPEYTGDFSLSDPVHNRNQVGLFLSNISKMFKSIVDRIFGIKNDIMKSFDNLKQELTSKLVHEMRSFGKV